MSQDQGLINRPKSAIPSFLDYVSLKNAGSQAKSYYYEVIPDNDLNVTAASGNIEMVFRIPSMSGQSVYLDPSMSYLTFQANFATNTGGFNVSGSDIINRLQVENAGVVVEDIPYYNILHSFLLDTSTGIDSRATFYNVSSGTSGNFSSVAANANLTAKAAGANVAVDTLANQGADTDTRVDEIEAHFTTIQGEINTIVDNVEAAINNNTIDRTGTQYSAATTVQISFPLVSLLGSLGEKYIPLSKLSSDLILRLTMETFTNAFFADATTVITLSNFRYVAGMIRLDQSVDNKIFESVNGVYTWHGTSFEHHRASSATGSGGESHLVPFRRSSLKSIYMLPTLQTNNLTTYGWANRLQNDLTSYQYSLDGELQPQTAIDCGGASSVNGTGQCLMELMKSFHGMSASNPVSSINRTNYDLYNGAGTSNATCGSFATGLELENYANKDTILSGVNSITSSIFCNLVYATSNANVYNDFYGLFDVLYVIENGVMSRRT